MMKCRKLIVLLTVTVLLGCQEEEIQPDFELDVPENLGAFIPEPQRNPMTKEGVELGRKIFFDPLFSSNGQVSCASCHLPSKAFTDGDMLSDNGVSGKALKRNSPTLVNLAWAEGLFWDGGAKDLESLSFGPLTHEDEMNLDMDSIIVELKKDESYADSFKAAFPDLGVSSASIGRALAQFQRTLISANSAYDQYMRGDVLALGRQELRGLKLFRQKCSSCHEMDHFTDFGYHNNGLDKDFGDDSFEGVFQGRYRITKDPADLGKYKTPTLRNVAITAPYMHDGRFKSLTEVLDHYDEGVKISATLDSLLISSEKPGIPLTEEEKSALISFLNTLTDYQFINQFSNENQ